MSWWLFSTNYLIENRFSQFFPPIPSKTNERSVQLFYTQISCLLLLSGRALISGVFRHQVKCSMLTFIQFFLYLHTVEMSFAGVFNLCNVWLYSALCKRKWYFQTSPYINVFISLWLFVCSTSFNFQAYFANVYHLVK